VTPAGDLVLAADGKLVVVSPGGAAREVTLPFSITGAPLVLGSGSVVVAGRDGQTHLLALDGARVASVPTRALEPQRWTSLIGGDLLLTASGAAELHLLSLHSGDERTLRLPERLATSPVVGDDQTIWLLGEGSSTLYGINTEGQTRFSAALGQGGPADGPALGWDGALRVGLRYGEIACFASDGQQRWRRGLDAAPGPMLIDADDNALFVSARGTLYAIDRQGELRWRQGLDVRGAGRPVLAADGTIYVVSRGGQIQAWR
jgi:outer membrane protein assembly factor BamB